MALSTQRASASFLSNESTPRWDYDVFLSFRGVDTRKGFVSHLYGELCKWQGIRTFFDDRELEGGSSIRLELLSAIEKSHTAIVVLSPDYASSKWCLDELTKILQCMEARKSVLPVFYDTDPSNVGNQRGSFAEAFEEHEKNLISKEKVVQWRAGLKRVSKITGKHRKNFKGDRELIEDIVKWVWMKVQATFTLSDSSRKLVGIDYAFEQLSLLLSHDANDVRFIGITGMGGIGKTTLAKLVYDKICHQFGVHCFLANVREVFAKNGIVDLAKKLLFPFLRERIAEIWDEERVSILIEKFLHNKKVLLVLDDVNELKQLEVLAGNQGWFGMGSRIIVTTRNQRLLVQHGIETSYKVQGLNDAEALELFSLHAFKKDQPEEDFLELSKHFLDYARGLPLVLKTLGSSLYARGQDAWNSVRDNLRKIPNPTVFDSLKVSYDGLEKTEKRIFLDVACLHKGKPTTEVLRILDNSFGISSSSMMDVLIERSLVYNDFKNKIWMHDLIQEMAWTIVCEESEDPGRRSRLWLSDDIFHILTTNTGSRAIEAISLCQSKVEEVRQWNCEAFSKMQGLRFLEFNGLIFSLGPKFLPCSLRFIKWSFYPSKFLPTSFCPYLLTELHMYNSKLVRLWEGKVDLPKLKYLNLAHSYKLINTPDFSGLPNLVVLYLQGCKNLVEIHPSVAFLKRLEYLSLEDCESIKSLPSEFEMDSLKSLSLGGCSNVKKIPEFGEQMKNLSTISLNFTAIEKIPSSIGHLVGLEVLSVCSCRNLLNLPRAICNLKSLTQLYVLECPKLDKLPGDMDHLGVLECGDTMTEPLVGMKNLEYLRVWRLDAKAREGWGLPRLLGLEKSRPNPHCCGLVLSSLSRLCSLRSLILRDCQLCEEDFLDDIGCLSFLEKLYLSGNNFVSLPESIRRLSKLKYLDLEGCKSLQELPPLPSNSKLYVNVDNCTSLKRLRDASKLSGRFTNLYDLEFSCKNCIALVQDEGWINTILSRIPRFVARYEVLSLSLSNSSFSFLQAAHPDVGKKVPEVVLPGSEIPKLPKFLTDLMRPKVVFPGSEIPKWFSNQSVGNSVNVKLPPPSCTDWLGIAFCLVFQDPEQNLANPPAHFDIGWVSIKLLADYVLDFDIGLHLSEHLCVFYWPREYCHQEQFLFETIVLEKQYADFNSVKKCGARLVYKQDLEELYQTLKILKRTHEYSDEEASSGFGSASFNDTEQIYKRHCY